MTDLDEALRAMLRERAQDVSALPPDITNLSPAPASHRGRWAIAASVAAVAALTATVLVLRGGDPESHHGTAAAGQSCRADLPSAWRHALGVGRIDAGPDYVSVQPLAAAPDGSLLATGDTKNGTVVVLIARGGAVQDVQAVTKVPGQDGLAAGDTDGRYVLLTILGDQGASADPGPGVVETSGPAVTKVLLVDSRDGHSRELATMTASDLAHATDVIDSAALQDGHVYWDVRPHDDARQGRIEDYNIAAGTTRTIDTGAVNGPEHSVTGVDWGSGRVAANVPVAVRKAILNAADAVTDGHAYAWTDRSGDISWRTADGQTIRPVRQHVVVTPALLAVAGQFVFFRDYDNSDTMYVLDTRTGGIADTGHNFGGKAFGGGGVAAFQFNVDDNAFPHVRIDTAALPSIYC